MTKVQYEVTVVAHSVHVRTTPEYKSNGSNVKGYAHKGNKFTASKTQNGWYYVDSLGGWMKESSKADGKILTINKKTINNTPPPPKPKPATKVDDKPEETPKKSILEGVKTTTFNVTNSNAGNIKNVQAKKNVSVGVTNHISHMMGNPNSGKLNDVEFWGKIPKGFNFSYREHDEAMKSIRTNHNIMTIDDRTKMFSHFNRFKLPVPDFALSKIVPYVFFTRPQLNIINSDGKSMKVKDNLFDSVFNSQPRIIRNLDANFQNGHLFNPLLSNSAMSFQASDEVLKTVDHGETYTGWKMVYGRHTNESNTAGQFSIQYMDSHNYDIYKMHKLWIDYINKVYRGEIKVSRKHIWEKILTYPCAVYYIVCAPDGETILYWSKYYGVFPINTPASASSFTHGSTAGFPEFSINYMYSVKEDFNPISLREFNFLSNADTIYRETYNHKLAIATNTFVGAPYIDDVERTVNGHKQIVHKLRFRN